MDDDDVENKMSEKCRRWSEKSAKQTHTHAEKTQLNHHHSSSNNRALPSSLLFSPDKHTKSNNLIDPKNWSHTANFHFKAVTNKSRSENQFFPYLIRIEWLCIFSTTKTYSELGFLHFTEFCVTNWKFVTLQNQLPKEQIYIYVKTNEKFEDNVIPW